MFCNLSTRSVNDGGLITLVSKSSCPREESITHKKLIPGRVSRVLIQGVGCRQIVYNTQNHYFSGENMDTLCNSLQFDLNACASDTLSNNLIACGDMNIPRSLGRYFDYSKPVPILEADAAKDAAQREAAMLRSTIEKARPHRSQPLTPGRLEIPVVQKMPLDSSNVRHAGPCSRRS